MEKKNLYNNAIKLFFARAKYFVERVMRRMSRNMAGARFHASVFEVHNLNGTVFVKSIRIHTKNLI